MSSLFSRDTEGLVRELGKKGELGQKGELVPTDSPASTLRLHPFCLVLPGGAGSWQSGGDCGAELSCSEPICFQETVAGAMTRGVSLGTGQQGKATSSCILSRSSLLAMRMFRVPPTPERLWRRRALLRWDLVLTVAPLVPPRESQLLDSPSVSCPLTEDDLRRFSNCHAPGFQLSLSRSQSTVAKEKAVGIPQGTVLTYRVLQLGMRRITGAPALYLPEGKLCRNASGVVMCHSGARRALCPLPGGMEMRSKPQDQAVGRTVSTGLVGQVQLCLPTSQGEGRAPGEGPGLQDLRRQAGAQLEALARLPAEPRLSLLGALRELLQSPRALQELKDRLEQALDTGVPGQLGGPGGLILSTLWVTSILEPNYNQMEETGFSLHPEVLSWLHHEDAALTQSLVESCGLELRGPGHSVTRDPEVVPQLSVLYASLLGLQLLAEPSSTALQADA
ncbi:gasdermin-A-like [Capricornis sumatraensis]|uniref:gasdermin-A-like n=1 Tax=Capricornis sumatraensis TaxID=34865 RepID=UPI0036052C82